MSPVVCDASVLFKLVVPESQSDRATALARSARIVVPDFAFLEIGNALWTRIARGEIDAAEAAALLRRLQDIGFDVRSIQPLIVRALQIASEIGHPIYDCAYLALAEDLGISVVTADRRFLAAYQRRPLRELDVKLLADVAGA